MLLFKLTCRTRCTGLNTNFSLALWPNLNTGKISSFIEAMQCYFQYLANWTLPNIILYCAHYLRSVLGQMFPDNHLCQVMPLSPPFSFHVRLTVGPEVKILLAVLQQKKLEKQLEPGVVVQKTVEVRGPRLQLVEINFSLAPFFCWLPIPEQGSF